MFKGLIILIPSKPILGTLVLILLFPNLCFAQPTFTNQGDVLAFLNDGPQSIDDWATVNSGTPPFSFTTNINSTTGTLTFDIPPSISADGTLSFSVTPGTSGTASMNTILSDANFSGLPTGFAINVVTNTAPQFLLTIPNIIIDEKSGPQQFINYATNLSAGTNPEELSQKLTFVIEPVAPIDPFMTFTTEPVIDEFGTLNFELSEFANGTANYIIYLDDDGSSTSPNVNRSNGVPFSIVVNPINDPPSFTGGENIQIDEHTGQVTIENWATNMDAGAPDEAGQTLTFVITQVAITSYLQFDSPVAVDENGTLTMQATPHYHGEAIYEIYLTDQELNSPIQAFTVTVDFINDPPTFVVGPDLVVDEGDQVYTYPNWATDISAGLSPDEVDQKLLFTVNFVQVTGNIAFLEAPRVDDQGQLVMRPTQHTHGEAIFDIILSDDGDFEPPSKNFGDPQSFSVTINRVNFPPDNIILSHEEVFEDEPPGTEVGFLMATDLDPEDEHTYALVEGEGSEDNSSFEIQQDRLLTTESFDWDVKRFYQIRVKTSDGEFSFEKNFTIEVLKVIEGITFANAITPNNDGENDVWLIEDIEGYPDASVFIYDKNGQPVFSSKGGYEPWDGTHNGKQLPMGTYFYIINLNDGSSIQNGSITIIL